MPGSPAPPLTLSRLLREAVSQSLPVAAGVVASCAVVAAAVNAWVHPEPIPFLARVDYEILVPCPEPGGEVTPIGPRDPRLASAATLLIDARSAADHARWHLPGARSLPYDYLDPTPPEALRELTRAIARAAARAVAVYGDGHHPDTGELLARELSGHGIRNVYFVRGGAPALRAAPGRRTPAGEAPDG